MQAPRITRGILSPTPNVLDGIDTDAAGRRGSERLQGVVYGFGGGSELTGETLSFDRG